jgi:hypothetical protein
MTLHLLPNFRQAAVALAMGATASLAAQQPAQPAQPRTLGAPDATYAEPFSQLGIGGIRELTNGRVIVTDPRDKVLQQIDFRTGTSVTIGREGSGPAEFGMPMRLFNAPSDTTLLFDPLNSRFLVIDPAAKPVNTFRIETERPAQTANSDTRARDLPAPGAARPGAQGGPPGGARPPAGGGQRITMGGMGFLARTSDAMGRLYAETPGFTMGPEGPTTSDTAAVLRYDRITGALDTMTWVKLQANNAQVSSARGGGMNFRIGNANPLAPRDEWTVFPDGKIAVVRAADYHVDWIMPNKSVVRSAAIRYTPIRMTDADKAEEEALRERARQNQMSVSVSIGGAGGAQRSAQMGPGANAPPLEPLTDWPDLKPPFRPGMASVQARPNGELWVRRTERAGAKGTLYDVLNAQGVVTHQVRIPEGWTLVGFGNGTVYTTKLDEDDLVYLQRHRL